MPKRLKELLRYPLVWVSALILVGFTAADFLLPDRVFSQFENKKLTQKPAFSLEAFFDSSYSTTYEKYINDQFPARDQWITLKSVAELGLGKLENNNILFGRDGYLFEKLQIIPAPDSSAGSNCANQLQIDRNLRFMDEFFQLYELPVTFALAPNSYAVMTDKLPLDPGTMPDQETLIPEIYESFQPDEDVTYLNFLPTLREHQGEYIYYRTDHHWTTLGAYYAYVDYCRAKGLEPVSLDALQGQQVEDFYGTYYNKCKKPGQKSDTITYYEPPLASFQFSGDIRDESLLARGELLDWNGVSLIAVDSLYQKEQFDTRDKYAAFTWGNNGISRVLSERQRAEGEEPRRLLLIKDSFANSMVPFLCYNYDEIVIVDLRSTPLPLSKLLAAEQFDDVFVLYNVSSFLTDTDIARLRF